MVAFLISPYARGHLWGGGPWTRVACGFLSCFMNHGSSPGHTGGEFANKNALVICHALVTSQLPITKSSISSRDRRPGTLTGRVKE